MNRWYEIGPRRYFFALRARPDEVRDVRWAIGARGLPLAFEAGGRLTRSHTFIGQYDLDDVSAVRSQHPAGGSSVFAHPCPGLERTLGFLTVRWRRSLPRADRAAIAEMICFALQGFVLREGDPTEVDPVQLGSLDLSTLAHDGGGLGQLFESNAYLDHVERAAARVAQRAGLFAYRAGGRIFVQRMYGKAGSRLPRKAEPLPQRVELWYFHRDIVHEAALGGFFDDDPSAE